MSMAKARRVLIIKTGFSEFLDAGISTTVSLGDVLICTAILPLFKKDHVTWVTSWQARELLQENSYIHDLPIFGPAALQQICKKSYDILVNLEKDIGICTMMKQIKAVKRYGFYFNEQTHNISTYKRSTGYLLVGQENHRSIKKTVVDMLYETVEEKRRGNEFILQRARRKPIQSDFGFNHTVGSKWPTKGWPQGHWQELEKILSTNYSISWQKGQKNLTKYIDWIDSCRIIVTSESLGQVIGLALGKQVVTLFGPTNPARTEKLKGVTAIKSTLLCPHMPCYLPFCRHDQFCMDHIKPDDVAQVCRTLIKKEEANLVS